MPARRLLDYDLLKQVFFEHPDWTSEQMARVLGDAARKSDPTAADPNPTAVKVAILRNKDSWARAAGLVAPQRTPRGNGVPVGMGGFLPPPGSVAKGHTKDTPLRHMRILANRAAGTESLAMDAGDKQAEALSWQGALKTRREILDLTSDGIPVVRRCVAAELDDDGNPRATAAWQLPGWRVT